MSVQISGDGVFDISNRDYHGDCCDRPSISSTGLRAITLGGADVYWSTSLYNPDRVERTESDAMRFGQAAHVCLLEPDRIAEQIAVSPYPDFRPKEARAWRDAQRAAGMIVVSGAEREHIERMRRSLQSAPEFRGALSAGRPEQSLVWREGDLYLKARLDWMPTSKRRLVIDLKTTGQFDPDGWARAALKHQRLDIQAWLQMEGVRRMLDVEPVGFGHLVVETMPPYRAMIRYWKADDPLIVRVMRKAERDARRALAIFSEGLASGVWPPAHERLQPITPPDWWLALCDQEET